jgi:hypothetical protein
MTSGSVSMDFDGMNARNIKSFANMNAFTGLSALNDETARIRDKKKKAQECLMNNMISREDNLSKKANVKQQITDNDCIRSHTKNNDS